jgi:hypothetical protein
MPMLMYLPMVIWMGMLDIAREETRAPAKTAKQKPNTSSHSLDGLADLHVHQ